MNQEPPIEIQTLFRLCRDPEIAFKMDKYRATITEAASRLESFHILAHAAQTGGGLATENIVNGLNDMIGQVAAGAAIRAREAAAIDPFKKPPAELIGECLREIERLQSLIDREPRRLRAEAKKRIDQAELMRRNGFAEYVINQAVVFVQPEEFEQVRLLAMGWKAELRLINQFLSTGPFWDYGLLEGTSLSRWAGGGDG